MRPTLLPLLLTSATFPAAAQVSVVFQDGVAPTAAYAGTRDVRITTESQPEAVWDPNANYDLPEVQVDGDPAEKAFLIRFELSAAVPASATVQSATLRLWCTNNSSDGIEAYALRASWTESEVSWRNRAAATPWEVGGAYGTSDVSPAAQATVTCGSTGAHDVPLPVALVQGWVAAPSSNHGLIFRGIAMDDGADFDSSEAGTSANRPSLTVVYNGGTSVTLWNDGVYSGCADSTIASGPDLSAGNYDGAPNSVASGTITSHSLVSFDLTALPQGSVVHSGELRLYVQDPSATAAQVRGLSAFWSETEATWTLRDASQPWAVAGARGAADVDPAALATLDAPVRGPASFPLSAAGVQWVQSWVDGSRPNFGFLLEAPAVSSTLSFPDRAHSVLSFRPALALLVTLPPGTAVLGAPPSPTEQDLFPLLERFQYQVGCGCSGAVDGATCALILLAPLLRRRRARIL